MSDPTVGRASVITEKVRAAIGIRSPKRTASEPIGHDTLRRFVQATMEPNPVHWDPEAAQASRYGTVVLPPLYPVHAFRRPAGTPDPLDRFSEEPEWDASSSTSRNADRQLPDLDLPFERHLNGGSEVEFFSMAKPGDVVSESTSYVDVQEKDSKAGPMALVITETEYENQDGELLLIVRRTGIHR